MPPSVMNVEVDAPLSARLSVPIELKDDVAVAPKYAGPYEENSVVDALWNVARPVCTVVPENVAAAAASVPVNVGDPAKTAAPVPLSSVSAAARLADDGVPHQVEMPVPSDVTPVPPLATASVPVTSAVSETVLQVATYAALMERTNWLVLVWVVAAVVLLLASATRTAEVTGV